MRNSKWSQPCWLGCGERPEKLGGDFSLRSLGQKPDGIKRRAGGDEKHLAIVAAKAQVRRRFRDQNLADQCVIRAENMNAVTRAGKNPASGVAADSVGHAFVNLAEDPAAGERAVLLHVEH